MTREILTRYDALIRKIEYLDVPGESAETKVQIAMAKVQLALMDFFDSAPAEVLMGPAEPLRHAWRAYMTAFNTWASDDLFPPSPDEYRKHRP